MTERTILLLSKRTGQVTVTNETTAAQRAKDELGFCSAHEYLPLDHDALIEVLRAKGYSAHAFSTFRLR